MEIWGESNRFDAEHYEMYRKLRNKVQNDIRNAKRQYMMDKINENKDNPVETSQRSRLPIMC